MTIMKNVISQLIDDFHERKLPELVTRDKEFSEVKGKADVVIGNSCCNEDFWMRKNLPFFKELAYEYFTQKP